MTHAPLTARDPLTLLGRHGPDSPVAWAGSETRTAADLVAHVAGIAELLEPTDGDEEIIVLCRDRYRFAVAVLAAWERGYAVALPPNPQLETIHAIRRRARVRTVIHDVDGVDKGIDVRDARVVSAARLKVGQLSFRPFDSFVPERKLATVYTSGSTGDHTSCPKTASQLVGEALALAAAFEVKNGARVLAMVPSHHIYGLLFGVLVPLVSGGSFSRHTPLHLADVAASLSNGMDVLVTVPAHLRALCGADPGELPPVERVFSSGAPLSPSVAEKVSALFGWTVTEVFGSSETGGIAWRSSGGEGPWAPLPGVQVSATEDGLLSLDSPFLHPDDPRPYVGADRIEVQPDGRFVHGGRADGVLKIGGVRVSLVEIERRIAAIDGVEDVGLLAVEVGGPRGHEVWVAVVAPELDASAIREGLRGWLAAVAMPRRLRLVESLPRGENGKLTRAKLEALFAAPRGER